MTAVDYYKNKNHRPMKTLCSANTSFQFFTNILPLQRPVSESFRGSSNTVLCICSYNCLLKVHKALHTATGSCKANCVNFYAENFPYWLQHTFFVIKFYSLQI